MQISLYVTYPAYNPTNGRFIGNTRTTPTYKDCDFEVRISGSAAYDDYFTVVSNLMEPTWPIVYGSDYYNLKHIYAYVGDMSISVQ